MRFDNDSQVFNLQGYEPRVQDTLGRLDRQGFSSRLWEKDASIWRLNKDGNKVIANRLGWLGVIETMKARVEEIISFADDVKTAGFTHAVLMGMGGSSLSPEVSRFTFGVREGYPDLMVLDSTVPAAVLDAESRIDPAKTLFIVSTKSGTTVETLSACSYFYDKVKAVKGEAAGENFVVITDPGNKLEQEVEDKKFRKLFLNFSDIGGRYSALSYFGLVPAAVIGVDISRLLDRAAAVAKSCGADISPSDNPGIALGAAMAELAMMGRDKMTMVLSPEIASFGSWVEQLVAESTGKMGRGVVPVDLEPLSAPASYGDDRFFVYLRLRNSASEYLDLRVSEFSEAAFPVITINLEDVYDLGGEYFRWEIATGAASAVLGVNAFDEPNVKESKDNTSRLLAEFAEKGSLPDESPVLEEDGIKLYCDAEMKSTLDRVRAALGKKDASIKSYLTAHLAEYQPGNYFVLMAFVKGSAAVDEMLGKVRSEIRDALGAATTLGYGPRFLHSTGQLHKGGPNNGIFIQITADDARDVDIPGEGYTFSILKQAQAQGDAIALRSKGRPLVRLHLGQDVEGGMSRLAEIIGKAARDSR